MLVKGKAHFFIRFAYQTAIMRSYLTIYIKKFKCGMYGLTPRTYSNLDLFLQVGCIVYFFKVSIKTYCGIQRQQNIKIPIF